MELCIQIRVGRSTSEKGTPRKEAQKASRMHANCSRGAANILGIYSFLLFTDRKCNSQIVSSTSGKELEQSKRRALTHWEWFRKTENPLLESSKIRTLI